MKRKNNHMKGRHQKMNMLRQPPPGEQWNITSVRSMFPITLPWDPEHPVTVLVGEGAPEGLRVAINGMAKEVQIGRGDEMVIVQMSMLVISTKKAAIQIAPPGVITGIDRAS